MPDPLGLPWPDQVELADEEAGELELVGGRADEDPTEAPCGTGGGGTSMPDRLELDALFRCKYFAKGLTHRACLRRQLERQEVAVTVSPARTRTIAGRLQAQETPAKKKTRPGPPTKPYCAERCEQGQAIRAGLAHVPARTCERCGTAILPGLLLGADGGACPVCEARALEDAGAGCKRRRAGRREGEAPALSRRLDAPPRGRIWDANALIRWLKSPAPTSGSSAAARFLLGVWNGGCGLKRQFDLFAAWASWDDEHRRAALAWLELPFWP